MWFRYLSVLLVLGSSLASAERRVEIGTTVYPYEIPHEEEADSSIGNSSLTINEMQADQYLDGNVLVAIGNSIYTVQPNGHTTLVAGSGVNAPAGYADGGVSQALFNNIAGFVQLPDDQLLIADENNQCIRQLLRYSGIVSTYAGRCNYTHFYDDNEYVPWQTFNKPTKLAADKNNLLYVVDMVHPNEQYLIVNKNLHGEFDQKINITTNGEKINDFLYDDQTDTFTVSISGKGVVNSSIYTDNSTRKFRMDDAFGITSYDDVLIVTGYNEGVVTFFDGYEDWSNFTICEPHSMPTCELNKPTSAAVASGWLYIGSSVMAPDEGKRKAVISKVSISTPEHPSFGTTTPLLPRLISTAVPNESGLGGTLVVTIVIVCLVLLALTITLITCCVCRNLNKRGNRFMDTNMTAQSRVPYSELQEA